MAHPPQPEAGPDRALIAGVAAAIALALALWDTRFHVAPYDGGVWRGLSQPPTLLRIVLSIASGLLAALATRRSPRRWRTPLLALALAGAPLIPVYTGHGLPLLALQGPVLSFVAGGAIGLALARRIAVGEPGRVPGLLLFFAPFAFYAALASRIPGAAGPQGDEPHYLTMAQSLWSDRDLDLTDEFADGEYSTFYAGRLSGHVSENSPPGRLYSIHSPGLAFLILPAYAALGHRGAQLVLCALAALAGVLVHRVVRTALDDRAAAITWAVFAFTPPVPIYAVTLYPETPALAATAYFLWTGRGRTGWREALGAAATAGALGWLHSKFLPLGALGLAFTLLRPCAWRVRATALAVFAGMVAGLLWYFRAFYGTPSLYAAIGPADLDLERLPRNLAALFFDRQFGLFAFAPVWLMALPGAVMLWRVRTGDAIRALALAAIPIAAGAAYVGWWGGSAPPARYVIPALPAIALAAAPALRARKDMAVVLGACGLVLVGLAADAPRILHNRGDGESLLLHNLAPAVDLGAFLPSFFDRDSATLVLTFTLLAVFALAWRFRLLGFAAGLAAYVLVAGALRDRPLVDRRLATEEIIDRWEPGHFAGPMGPPSLRTLAMPLELPRGPWVLGAGEQRNSRRTGLPPGAYRIELRASPVESGPFRIVVDLYTGELSLGEAVLSDAQPSAAFPLLLPGGVRQLGLTAMGEAGRARLDDARVVPEAVVPRHLRDDYPYPLRAIAELYRVGGPLVHATAVDRSEPEDGGFRLEGPEGAFLVDGPPAAAVRFEVRRVSARAGDEVRWGGRVVPLGGEATSMLVLPMAEGEDLGRASVVPVRVRAPGAWVRFSAEGAAP
jgi:hypothetical protein